MITPLALVGGFFYSARSLAEPWATLTRIDPLYYLVDATRAGLTSFHESPAWLSLLVAAAVAVGALLIASRLFARGWRLKPQPSRPSLHAPAVAPGALGLQAATRSTMPHLDRSTRSTSKFSASR